MESSALASLMPPPAAASAAAGMEGTSPPTAAGAAFAAVLSATELTAAGPSPLALSPGALSPPLTTLAAEPGKGLPEAAVPGRFPVDVVEAEVAPADATAVTADLLEALGALPGAVAQPGGALDEGTRRAARRPIGADDQGAHSDTLALTPLTLAIRNADPRSAPKFAEAPVGPTSAHVGGGAVAASPSRDGLVGRSLGAEPWLLESVEQHTEADLTMPRSAVPAADAVLRAMARDATPAPASSGAPLPLASAARFAALDGAGGHGPGGEGALAPSQSARTDPAGLSASWSAVDDARLAAFARGGVDGSAVDQVDIDIPVGGRSWERVFGERVVWLMGQQIQAAEIKLNPPHLGPLEVRLTLSGGEASLSFGTPHAPVREAIEQALPRLREQLAEQNVVLVNVDVGDRGVFGQAAGRQEPQEIAPARAGASAAPEALSGGTQTERGPARGLVDEYA